MSRLCLEQARVCFLTFRAWFGGPPAEFRGSTLDGRIRLATLVDLGWPDVSPEPVHLETAVEAVRWCVVSGHHERALELCTEHSIAVDGTLPIHLVLPPFMVAPVVALTVKRRRGSARRHRKRTWRAREYHTIVSLARSARESNRLLSPEEVLDCCDPDDSHLL